MKTRTNRRFPLRRWSIISVSLLACLILPGWSQSPSLAQQIATVMSQSLSGKAGQRFVHAKGIVCEGDFVASRQAANVSRAAHLRGGSVPITVRFSQGAGDASIPDTSPNAGPQGMAIRFLIPGGTDIVAMSHNGFVVGSGEEFLDLQRAIFSTDPASPHPWPIEQFLGSHPRALAFVRDNHAVPESFATEAFFGNNAFRFLNSKGTVQAGRYQIVPESGVHFLPAAAVQEKGANFLREELTVRLAAGPLTYRLMLQLPNAEDKTNDGSKVWPSDRKRIELGVITIHSVVADSVATERKLAFDPVRLTDGIELSDDPLPALRSQVYALAAAPRHKAAAAPAQPATNDQP